MQNSRFNQISFKHGEVAKVFMLKKLTTLLALMLLCAACTGTATPFELPTVAVLPSITPTAPEAANISTETPTIEMTEAAFAFTVAPQIELLPTYTLPVPTEQMEMWYSTDVMPVYSCPEL